jgi:competence protein ComEA
MLRFFSILLAFLALTLSASAGINVTNVNTADAAALDQLPGIGPTKAAAIIAYRKQNTPFASCKDLERVKGIGVKTREKICPHVVFVKDGKPAEALPKSAMAGAPGAGAVNINTADEAALDQLHGIGPTKAAAIIAYREQNGLFASCKDLERVKGIGVKTVDGMVSQCTVQAPEETP